VSDLLSAEERFTDRLEIVGYFTASMAAIILIMYFGMIFFYHPVQLQPPATKLLILLLSIFVLSVGFFIPRANNVARISYRLFFYLFATFAYFRTFVRNEWFFAPVIAYAFYVLWVLGHPVSIRFFRKLRPHEEQQLPAADWFTLHRIILTWYSLITGINGLLILNGSGESLLYDPDKATLQIFLSLMLFFLLIFFRHLKNWARWCVAFISLIIGTTGIPDTISTQVQNYFEYWKTLANVFYFLGLAAYLIFSPRIKTIFKKSPADNSSTPVSAPPLT